MKLNISIDNCSFYFAVAQVARLSLEAADKMFFISARFYPVRLKNGTMVEACLIAHSKVKLSQKARHFYGAFAV